MEYHLRSSAWVNGQPQAGVYEMTFTTKLTTLAATLTLSWNGNTVVFYVESTTTPSGYNLPQDIASTTLAQYVEFLAEVWFPAQYLLEKDFIIENIVGNKVRFTAKQPGTELQLTYSTTIPSGQATMATTTAPIAWGFLDDYQVIMDVELEETYGSGEFTRIGTLSATPVLYDDAGTWKGDVKFDIQELLDGALQTRHDPPTLTASVPTIADNTNLRYRVIYAERFNVVGTTVFVRRVQSGDSIVLKGGLQYLDVPAVPDLEHDFYTLTDKPFNTWQPIVKEVTAAEPHFLYFFTDHQLTGSNRFHLRAEVYYTDGTTDTATLMSTDVQSIHETYYYRVSFNDEGLDALQPTKTPYKYTIYIDETGAAITTQVVTFWLVDETRNDRFFLFENSAQGWDTLRCNGNRSAINNVVKVEAANMLQAGYAATDATVVQKTESTADTFEIFTGFKPKAEIMHLRDFLRSEKVFEVVDGALVPVVVNGGSFELETEETGNYGYGLKFRYRHAFVNKGYSNA